LIPQPDHSVELILNPRQNLGIALKYCQNLRVRLLKDADLNGQYFSPLCEASTMVRGAKEENTTSAIDNGLKMSFWSSSGR
jgi:hypothetical protein